MNSRSVVLVTAACIGLSISAAGSTRSGPSAEDCHARDNDTQAKLLECITEKDLWSHLKVFQKIADANPGPNGHGNRNTGSSGYKASVAYVAKLMRQAGYKVTVQSYVWRRFDLVRRPVLEVAGHDFGISRDWFVARLSGNGSLTAAIQPVGGASSNDEAASGCAPGDFAGFKSGHVALLERGACDYDDQVANAEAVGAAAVIIYNGAPNADDASRGGRGDGRAFEANLIEPANIPVIGVVSNTMGAALSHDYSASEAPSVHLDVETRRKSDIDYNVIADAPLGDPNHVVVLEGHLDAIYGAGMLDNASGSTTMLEIALNMAHTRTRHQLRYIWFGGEELGLLGSKYYTKNLTQTENHKIVFDIDADVTATPNFAILVADPKNAWNVKKFPRNVITQSEVGNDDFTHYFNAAGLPPHNGSNDGTDSNSFALVGIPNTGLYTQQDCCKQSWAVKLWGGYLGDFEGVVPGWHEQCVDTPHRWCDNLANNDPFVFEFASKAVAAVTLKLANDAALDHERRP